MNLGRSSAITAFDLRTTPLREVNAALHAPDLHGDFVIENPAGAHNVAVGLDAPVTVTIDGHVGYYAAGMNQHADVIVNGNAGTGVAENMMSGIGVGEGQRVAVRRRHRTRRTARHRRQCRCAVRHLDEGRRHRRRRRTSAT